jgi:cobalt-zinc-cadmium efflux system membrane fusion protein
MKTNRWKFFAWGGAMVVVAAAVIVCVAAVAADRNSDSPAPQAQDYKLDGATIEVDQAAAQAAGIREMTIQPRDVPMTLTLTARTGLNMENVAHVHAQFGGKVTAVGPELGARVKGPGEAGGPTVLCVIESNDLAQAKANWIQASVQLKLDEDALERTRELVKSTVLAPKFLIDAESAVTKDRAALEAARQQLLIFGLSQKEIDEVKNQVGRQRMDYVITSPRSGVIAEKGVAGGEIADPTINLFTVADTSTMWVWGDVYERDLHWIKVGQPVKVFFTSEPERARDCRIEWISPSLDPNTHSIRVRASLDNTDGHLLADMYGTMVVTIQDGKNSIVVPSDAVVRQETDAFVFVRVEPAGGRARYRRSPVTILPVSVGFGASGPAASSAIGSAAPNSGKTTEDSGSVRVLEGLQPGDVIVRSGALGLFNEMEEQAKGQ